jgi:hypothetical protein
MRGILTLSIVAAATAAVGAQTPPARPDIDLHGKLYRSVFVPGPGTLSDADVAALPEPFRGRLSRYLARRASFKSQLDKDAGSFEQARAEAKKREIERAIVALIESPGTEAAAVEFVRNAPIAYEWEGSHEGPVSEAAHAEEVLKKNASSALAPYLYLFIAQRQRVAFETYEHEKNTEGMKAAARKYRSFLQRARAANDPLVGLIADDLDRQLYLYIKTEKHPGSYDPDA